MVASSVSPKATGEPPTKPAMPRAPKKTTRNKTYTLMSSVSVLKA